MWQIISKLNTATRKEVSALLDARRNTTKFNEEQEGKTHSLNQSESLIS